MAILTIDAEHDLISDLTASPRYVNNNHEKL